MSGHGPEIIVTVIYPRLDGKLLIMTPIDPVFLLIPLLRLTQPVRASTQQYLIFADISPRPMVWEITAQRMISSKMPHTSS